MLRLTGIQIGRLAEHVEAALRAHPKEDHRIQGIQAWEKFLRTKVQRDPLLPEYIDLEDEHAQMLEDLINYFAE